MEPVFVEPRGNPFGKTQMTKDEITAFLEKNHCAELAFENINGYPGLTPVNLAWNGKSIYIHCAPKGERHESLQLNPKVTLNVYYDANEDADDKGMARHYSVTAYGMVNEIQDDAALEALDMIAHQSGKDFKMGKERNKKFLSILKVYEIVPTHITGRVISWKSK